MLTALASTLLLSTLLQDAPAAAPESAPAVENDPKAVALLEEFDAMLYVPEDHGLESLAFDLELPGPMGGKAGVLSVTWSKAAGASGTFEMSDSMKAMVPEPMRAQMMEQMDQQMGTMARQIASIQTNRVVRDLLEDATVALQGVQDGYVTVVATPREDGPVRTLSFEDGVLVQTRQTMTGQMGMEVESTGVMNWGTLGGDSELLVLESSTDSMSGGGGMGSMEQSSVYHRGDVAGFRLVTSIEGKAMGRTSTLAFSHFVVNGEPVATEAGAMSGGDGMGEGEGDG